MTIKNRWAFFFALLMLCFSAYFFIDRWIFMRTAQKTMAVVKSEETVHTTCRRRGKNLDGIRNKRRDCTKFYATMEFVALNGQTYQVRHQTGEQRGHNRQVVDQDVGEQVAWVYSPHNPKKNFPDTFSGIWGFAVMGLVGHLFFLFISFIGGHRYRFTRGGLVKRGDQSNP